MSLDFVVFLRRKKNIKLFTKFLFKKEQAVGHHENKFKFVNISIQDLFWANSEKTCSSSQTNGNKKIP